MTNLELISELKQRIENETFGYIKIMDKPDDDILKKCYQMRYSGWWMKTGDNGKWNYPINFDVNLIKDDKQYLVWCALPPLKDRNKIFTENNVVYIEEFSSEMLELEELLYNNIFKEFDFKWK